MDNNFPKYNKSTQIGDIGVTMVEYIILNKLGWKFRKNHLEDDFGIDGYIDLITETNYITGKSIAVQIKCGSSFFSDETSIGWHFNGSKKHLNYYLNNQLPIVIILVNPDTQKIYWALFKLEETTKSGENWKIMIPSNQELNVRCKPQLEKIAGVVIDYTPQLEYYWEVNNLLENSGYIMLSIDKMDIENLNTELLLIHFAD